MPWRQPERNILTVWFPHLLKSRTSRKKCFRVNLSNSFFCAGPLRKVEAKHRLGGVRGTDTRDTVGSLAGRPTHSSAYGSGKAFVLNGDVLSLLTRVKKWAGIFHFSAGCNY